jgi:heat shock protein 4
MDASAAAIGNYLITYYLIIGVDIGSLKSVLAAVRKGGIDIILSDTTNKQTPMVVGYTDEERLIGDAAMN